MGRLNTNPTNANPKHVGIGTLANAAAEKVEAGAKCPWLFAEDNEDAFQGPRGNL
jgi:hypothetical protein